VVLKLLGYSDRIYGRPGDNIRFMVSCEAMTYDAEIVRIICGDDNPAGPGIKQEVFASSIAGVYQGRRQNIAAGSYVSVPINQK
jgi:N,N-dimethylformamidase